MNETRMISASKVEFQSPNSTAEHKYRARKICRFHAQWGTWKNQPIARKRLDPNKTNAKMFANTPIAPRVNNAHTRCEYFSNGPLRQSRAGDFGPETQAVA
ncbi:hypothetical protein CGZ80_13870 [Rhodopirellula sp. MGV]|nr:hypothetical protein CGZ80_13870 [Rhodopirellula sp. MGV]PNY34330.1 hypothetical protein C2E31_24185 [Rhodopirellula baltica]